jgi:hypothetical protein
MNDDFGAALDQAQAGLSDLAKILGQYRAELMENGFTRLEALTLVLGFQTAQLGPQEEKS